MKSGDVVRKIIKDLGINQTILAQRIGASKRQIVNNRLKYNSMTIAILYQMLRVLDYKIVVVPRETRLPDGCYEVDS